MAIKKKKKFLIIGGILLAVAGFFIRPLKGNYYPSNGNNPTAADLSTLQRVGLFGVELKGTSWKGTINMFGRSISWTNSNGDTDTWVRK